MTDFLTRGFRAQLTLNMEATLKKAVCDIMRIFENSLHDHQLELVQKGEEVAHLKVKLQTAELKLRDWECKLNQGAEKSKTQTSETQREPGIGMNPSGQTTDVPEIDFEVPDDWCAPMGDEMTITKQDDIVCPSIRLRPLMIPLHRIPIIKQEVISHDIESHQPSKGVRKSTRCSTLNEKSEHTQDEVIRKSGPGERGKSVRGDINRLLLDRQYNAHQTDSTGLRSREKHGKKTKNKAVKSSREICTKSEETMENNGQKYSCKICEKSFDTEFGQFVHTQSHSRCLGCKKVFPLPSSFECHKQKCKQLKKLLARKALRAKQPSQSREQVILKKESSPPSGHHRESSVQNVASTKQHSCVHCHKKFFRKTKLRDHMRVHTGEKPFTCRICPKKFTLNWSLKTHMRKIHHNQTNPSELSEHHGDLAWTMPLEDTETTEHLILPSKDAHPALSNNNVQRKHSPRKRSEWQTMGVRSADGYICSICKKLLKTRIILIEHYRIHSGEKPHLCHACPARFRTFQQRHAHRKRFHSEIGLPQCEKCKKVFPSNLRYNTHVSKCLVEKPIICKDCGKGFSFKGHFLNHMARCHT